MFFSAKYDELSSFTVWRVIGILIPTGDIKHAEIQHLKAKPSRPESAPRPRRLTRRQHAGVCFNRGVGLEDDILTKNDMYIIGTFKET